MSKKLAERRDGPLPSPVHTPTGGRLTPTLARLGLTVKRSPYAGAGIVQEGGVCNFSIN